jgi:hypothetical protein
MDLALLQDSEDGGGEVGGVTVHLYCNPNAHGSAFDAKVLVRVECRSAAGAGAAGAGAVVRMAGEARLTDVQGTLEVYWESAAPPK